MVIEREILIAGFIAFSLWGFIAGFFFGATIRVWCFVHGWMKAPLFMSKDGHRAPDAPARGTPPSGGSSVKRVDLEYQRAGRNPRRIVTVDDKMYCITFENEIARRIAKPLKDDQVFAVANAALETRGKGTCVTVDDVLNYRAQHDHG